MPMPYTLTRGPLLTIVENALNADRATRVAILADLRSKKPLPTVLMAHAAPPPPAAVVPKGVTADVRLDEDWIGRWPPDPADPIEPTGYWIGYRGDVAGVLREGLVRALEVALGLAAGEDPARAGRAEPWPIQLDWKCPNPYFEVWVTWRRHPAPGGPTDTSRGQVNLLLATPPDTSNRLTTRPEFPLPPNAPQAPPPTTPPAAPLPPPTTATATQGMWLIAHQEHVELLVDIIVDARDGRVRREEVVPAGTHAPRKKGEWAIPSPTTFWEDRGPVVVVAPPPSAGGAVPSLSTAP